MNHQDYTRIVKPILEPRAEDLKIIAGESQLSPEQRGERLRELRGSAIERLKQFCTSDRECCIDHDQK
jgi:hypothetical protein